MGRFKLLYEDTLTEIFDTKIKYEPLKNNKEIYQDFIEKDKTFRVSAQKFKIPGKNIKNIYHIEFKNLTDDSYKITNTVKYPWEIYSIVIHWIHNFIEQEQVDTIIFGSEFDERESLFNKKNEYYNRLVNKYTNRNLIRNTELENDINNKQGRGKFFVLDINES